MSDSTDVHLQLKKRARRRLIGALAFAGLAAVVLPMVMDDEPRQQVQDVQIRIPGQDQTPFVPKVSRPAVASEMAEKPVAARPEPVATVAPAPNVARPPEKPVERKAEKPVEKALVKPPEKVAEKPLRTPDNDPQRAAAILGGKAMEMPGGAAANGNGQYVILIGAFSNPANVKQLQTKIGELGIKVYTESLDAPEGRKTRVRAGPFPTRDAADKALDRMKRIGVNGVVAAKQ